MEKGQNDPKRRKMFCQELHKQVLKITKSDLSLKICFPFVELFLQSSVRGKISYFYTSLVLLGSGMAEFQSCLKRRKGLALEW